MRTDFQQFYVAPEHVQTDVFFLTDDEYRHAVKVLRKQKGDRLAAIDGLGSLYFGLIQFVEKNRVVVAIEKIEKNVGEPLLNLTIAQAIPKGNAFDLVVEKGTEIGVSAFQPILTQHCQIDPTSRIERWQHKALAATKQCGRSRCPIIRPPLTLDDLLKQHDFDSAFIAHEEADLAEPIGSEKIRQTANVVVIIGPEGGFTDREVQQAKEAGVTPIHLGQRRLRSETAALVAAVQILSAAGELGQRNVST